MWWKTFSAVLAAGLVMLAIVKIDRINDRDAANWDELAGKYVQFLKYGEEQFSAGNPTYLGTADNPTGLRGTVRTAEEMLNRMPSRAKKRFELEQAVKYAKETIAEGDKKIASAKP